MTHQDVVAGLRATELAEARAIERERGDVSWFRSPDSTTTVSGTVVEGRRMSHLAAQVLANEDTRERAVRARKPVESVRLVEETRARA